jgi:hypothetical protein
MWEKLTPADIARVRHELSLSRAASLSRHAAELKVLDTQQEELEKFESLVEAFATMYLNADASTLTPTGSDEGQSTEFAPSTEQLSPAAATAEEVSKPAPSDAPQDAATTHLDVQHQVSPNFGIPLRRFVGR